MPYEEFEVEKIFLMRMPNDERRGIYSCIRNRAMLGGGPCAYGQTIVENIHPESPRGGGGKGVGGKVQQLQLKRLLTRREYEQLGRRADPARYPVKQRRASFLYENRYYCVTRYTSPPALAGLAMVYCQLEEAKSHGEAGPPPFLAIGRELTGLPEYSCYTLSKIDGLH